MNIFVSAFDMDSAWDGENSVSVDVLVNTPVEAMRIKKNLRHLTGDNKRILIKAFTQWREDNSFISANLRFTDHVCTKHTIVVSEEDYTSDYYAWCEQVNEKYNREDKPKAFLTKIEKGFETPHMRTQFRIFEVIALAAESWEEYEQLLKADAAKSDTELNMSDDDEEIPF